MRVLGQPQDSFRSAFALRQPLPVSIARNSPTLIQWRAVLLVNGPVDHDDAHVPVPLSFSPSCAAALRMAGTIAPNAELRRFQAVPIPFSGLTRDGVGSDMARELWSEATKEWSAWAAAVDPATAPPGIEIISGGSTETMAQRAAGKPDLIAMGAHTRSGLLLNVLGSFFTDLTVTPPCDVLIART